MKKVTSLLLALAMMLVLLAGCGEKKPGEMNVYVLAGPTGIGAMNLWSDSEAGSTRNSYHFTMTAANDEIVAAVSGGQADIAAVATNLAATLYNKTQGVTVLAVNTLGVLSLLDNSGSVSSLADLKGRTIYAPGQGANPEYILRYVLSGNGIDPDKDVTIQFVGEGSELLSVWNTDPQAIILAPQPVATSILMQHKDAKTVCDMTDAWNDIAGADSALMMGCVIVRNEYLQANPDAVAIFLEEYQVSIQKAVDDAPGTAALCEHYGLIPKAALAEKAIPACGLTFVSGSEMQTQLAGYLQVMFDANPKSIGGAMPGDAFYYHA
jgi:NitT/TauT family transport system substrate-binding protein